MPPLWRDCGGNIDLAKFCADDVVAIFSCEADANDSNGDKILSGEEKDVFICYVSGKYFDEKGRYACLTDGNLPLFATIKHHGTFLIHSNPTYYCNVTILPMVTKDLPISPRFSSYEVLWRFKFSTLTTRQPMVELYLLAFSRFPLRTTE